MLRINACEVKRVRKALELAFSKISSQDHALQPGLHFDAIVLGALPFQWRVCPLLAMGRDGSSLKAGEAVSH